MYELKDCLPELGCPSISFNTRSLKAMFLCILYGSSMPGNVAAVQLHLVELVSLYDPHTACTVLGVRIQMCTLLMRTYESVYLTGIHKGARHLHRVPRLQLPAQLPRRHPQLVRGFHVERTRPAGRGEKT